MEFEKYEALLIYLSEKKYPKDYTDNQKKQLRKVSGSFLLKNGELHHLRDGTDF